jgi:hypothetical protein
VRELSPTVPWLELVRSSAMDRFEQLGFLGSRRRVEVHEPRDAREGEFVPRTRGESLDGDVSVLRIPKREALISSCERFSA